MCAYIRRAGVNLLRKRGTAYNSELRRLYGEAKKGRGGSPISSSTECDSRDALEIRRVSRYAFYAAARDFISRPVVTRTGDTAGGERGSAAAGSSIISATSRRFSAAKEKRGRERDEEAGRSIAHTRARISRLKSNRFLPSPLVATVFPIYMYIYIHVAN